MRVLLAPFETAGVAGAQRDGLRALGHRAELWTIAENPFVATQDRMVVGYAQRAAAAARAPLGFDVLHYHFGTTLLEFADAAWSRVARRPLVLMHYWGSDCRVRAGDGRLPGADAAWERQQAARERVIRRRLRIAGRLCAAALVSDLELAGFVQRHFRATYLVPTPLIAPRPGTPAGPLPDGPGAVVLHAPSHRLVKGTEAIVAAMDAAAEHVPLRPRVVSGVPRDVIHAEVARADIVVDQLNSVTSGVFALEAMALGKPVLLQYRRELLAPFARDTPLVPVTAGTLAGELVALATDGARRAELGAAGRAFVSREHDATVVARRLEAVYDHARSRLRGLFEVTADGIRPLPSPA